MVPHLPTKQKVRRKTIDKKDLKKKWKSEWNKDQNNIYGAPSANLTIKLVLFADWISAL